jgi:hypothetical protein
MLSVDGGLAGIAPLNNLWSGWRAGAFVIARWENKQRRNAGILHSVQNDKQEQATAGPSTSPLAVRLREATLRMTARTSNGEIRGAFATLRMTGYCWSGLVLWGAGRREWFGAGSKAENEMMLGPNATVR